MVVPAYQAERWVDAAIASVLAQEPAADEIIVVDDGSTDRTAERLAAYGDALTVISQPNGGEAAARNAGARAASGDFVAFLDADDEFLPGRLAALRRAMRVHPDADIITTNASITVGTSAKRHVYDASNPFPNVGQRAEILRRNFVFGHATVRRSRLLEVGGYDESLRFATDWDLWLRLVVSGSTVHLIDRPLSIYRLHADSLSADRQSMLDGQLALLQKATVNPYLTEDDQVVLASSLANVRRERSIADLQTALRTAPGDIRRCSVALLGQERVTVRGRATALVGMLAPRVAHWVVRRKRSGEPRRSHTGYALDEPDDGGTA